MHYIAIIANLKTQIWYLTNSLKKFLNISTLYYYTSDGSLTHYIITNTGGNTVEKTSVNGQTKTITTGSDDDGMLFVNNDGVTNETSTDDFGRTTQVRTVRSNGALVFNTD